VLADYLTQLGIAVLRVDDRGVGGSSGDFTKATSEDFASDVLAGVEYLKNRKEIDPERIFTMLKEEKDNVAAEERVRSILQDAMSELEGKERKIAEANAEVQIQQLLSPWFRFFLTYDPRPILMKVKCPLLAINGEKDLQVPSEENLSAIEEALKAGGNKDYTIKELPDLDHLFQTAETGALSEYAKIEETISPTALKVIGQWILERTKKPIASGCGCE